MKDTDTETPKITKARCKSCVFYKRTGWVDRLLFRLYYCSGCLEPLTPGKGNTFEGNMYLPRDRQRQGEAECQDPKETTKRPLVIPD